MVTAAPVNSLIRAQLKPVDEGAEIKAEAGCWWARLCRLKPTALGSLGFQSKTRKHNYMGMDKAIRGLSLV